MSEQEKLILRPNIVNAKRLHLSDIVSIEQENHSFFDEDFQRESVDELVWNEEKFFEILQKDHVVARAVLVGEHVAAFFIVKMEKDKGRILLEHFEIAKKFMDTDIPDCIFKEIFSHLKTPYNRVVVLEPDNRLDKHLLLKSFKFKAIKTLRNVPVKDVSLYKFEFSKK